MVDDATEKVRRALVVVHEQPVGPVARVAAAVATGLREEGLRVSVTQPRPDIDWSQIELLVVGSSAIALASQRPAELRRWLTTLPTGREDGPALATYETRLSRRAGLRGAAAGTAVGLWSRGWRVASAPAVFFLAPGGGLAGGELSRAARWGHDLASGYDGHGPLHDGAGRLGRRHRAPAAQLAGALL